MRLDIHHHKVFIHAEPEEIKALRKHFKIYIKNFSIIPGSPQFTVVDLFNWRDNSFPTGYLEPIKKKFKQSKIDFVIRDERVFMMPHLNLRVKKMLPPALEPQVVAAEAIKHDPVGVVSSPTGSGKSWLIYNTVLEKQVKTLIVVPTTSIQNQLYKEMSGILGPAQVSRNIPRAEQYEGNANIPSKLSSLYAKEEGEEDATEYEKPKAFGSGYTPPGAISSSEASGRIGKGYVPANHRDNDPETEFMKGRKSWDKKNPWKKKNLNAKHFKDHKSSFKKIKEHAVTILCYQALPEVPVKFLESVEMVIIDEYHHSAAETIRDALQKMSRAAYRYGFSATPWRDKSEDMKLLTASLGDKIIYELSAEEAIEKKIIVAPKIEMIGGEPPEDFIKGIKHWRTILEKGIIGNKRRNKQIVNLAVKLKEDGHNVFICVDEIAHLEILKMRLEGLGFPPLVVHGQQNTKTNEKNVKEIAESTESTGLISIGTMAVGEGTNMPEITAVILGSGGKSSIRVLQRIGRGVRKTARKDTLLVYDFFDWFHDTLKKHSIARKNIYVKYYGEKNVKT